MDPQIQATARRLIPLVKDLQDRALAFAQANASYVADAAPDYQESAHNLLHYLAVRQSDVRELQNDLAALGLSSLGRLEAVTLVTLNAVLAALHCMADVPAPESAPEPPVDFQTGPALLARHTRLLLGDTAGKRAVRIMVTMPSEAAVDPGLIRSLLAAGMDAMRVNCAHDDAAAWLAMIANLRRAERELGRPCKVYADLGGPKLRTGDIVPAGRIIRFRPKRDLRGRVIEPARIDLVEQDSDHEISGALPLPKALLEQIQPEDELWFDDTRGRDRKLALHADGPGAWYALSEYTCFIESDLPMRLMRKRRQVMRARVGELVEVTLPIALRVGEQLLVTREDILGAPARLDETGRVITPASIPCTLPAVFESALPGERIWFDDGKIGGMIADNDGIRLLVTITQAPPAGARLRSGKGINLPDTQLEVPALTAKDLRDLEVLAAHVDIFGLSFVRSPGDVEQLEDELTRLNAQNVGIVMKIENRQAFESLPGILLASLKSPPVGVMVARGDLAVEVGFERLAEVQEEILWLCEAAHVPVIWATQVLESLAKSGQPSRAEVSDAAMSGRAECVMLNKGPYIGEAVQFLNGVLERMDAHQSKKRTMLRRLAISQSVGSGPP